MAFIAPAGTPIRLADLASLVPGFSSEDAGEALARRLTSHAGSRHCWLISTGRAAMTLLLQTLKEQGDVGRTEVIIPAYTCYSVAASVARAGLKPRLCDIDPRTLSPDLERLRQFNPERTLAIVSANLYGLPNALFEIEAWARENGVAMIDDAAQALGASYAGRAVGGFGDAGIYSFDKGKNITSLEGGAIVAKGEALCVAIQAAFEPLPANSAAHSFVTSAKLAVYALLLRPTLYGIVQSLPFLGLGRTVYEDSYPITRYSSTLARMTKKLYERLAELTSIRECNATALLQTLRDVREITPIDLLPSAKGAYTRLPILVPPDARHRILSVLQSAGIGATASYPNALCDVPEVVSMLSSADREMPGAREVANRIVTLPTHAYSPADLPSRVRDLVISSLRG